MTDDGLSNAELRSATLHGLRWTLIARPIVEVLSLVSLVLLARLVSPAEFGRFAVALVVQELIIIPGQGVGVALVQRPHATRAHVQASFALSLIVGLLLVGITFVGAAWIVDPIFGERTAMLVRLTTPASFLTTASIVSSSLLQRRLQFRRLSLIDVTTTIVCVAASIALALAGMRAVALILGLLAQTVVGAAMMWWWAPAPPPWLRRTETRQLLAYGGPAALAAVSWVGFRNCDYAIVGARLGAMSAGIYFRAYTLGVEYQKKVSLVMTSVGFPVLARTRGSQDKTEMCARMVGLLTVVLFPLLVMLAIIAPVFVPWMFGSAWSEAVVPTQILAIGGAATLVIDAVGATLMAQGRARAMLGYGWGHFVTYGLTVFIVAPLGLAAVATAAAVVHTIFLVVAYLLMFQGAARRALTALWHDTMPAIASCCVLAAVAVPASRLLSAMHSPPVAYLGATTIVGVIAYLLAIRTMFPASLAALRAVARHVLPVNPLLRARAPVSAAPETQSAG